MIDINKQPDPLPSVLPKGTTWGDGKCWGTVDEPLKLGGNGGEFCGKVPFCEVVSGMPDVADPGCVASSWVCWPSYYEALEKQQAELPEPFDPIAYAREKLPGWYVTVMSSNDSVIFFPPDSGDTDRYGHACVRSNDTREIVDEQTGYALDAYGKRRGCEDCGEPPGGYIDGVLYCQECFDTRQAKLSKPESAEPKPERCHRCREPFHPGRPEAVQGMTPGQAWCADCYPDSGALLDARIATAQAEYKAKHPEPKPVEHPWEAWSTATWDAP